MSRLSMKKFKACPFCGGEISQKYSGLEDRLFTTSEKFNVYECTSCKVAMLNPMPTGDASKYYPVNYLSGEDSEKPLEDNRKVDIEKWYRYNQYRYDFKLLTKASGVMLDNISSYVDIGCGSGERVTFMAEQGCKRPHGVDKFNFAKNKSKLEAQLINSEITKFKPTKKYQVASMFHVLEHVENPRQVLEHIRSHVLEKGGNLIIQVPNYASLEVGLFKHRWFGFDVPRHLWQYNDQALTRLLTEAGYTVADTYQTNAPLHPVTFVPSLFKELDVQRIWVNRNRGVMYKRLMTTVWAVLTVVTIPLNIIINMFGKSSMLTVVATSK